MQTDNRSTDMIIERDVPITADDGLVLHADVYRPKGNTPVPVIMVQGPYGKGVEYKDAYKASWDWMCERHPDWLPGSKRQFMTWETVDPEIWTIQWNYAVVRIDSRGTGRTSGYLDIFGPREIKDFYDAIEWAGIQPWSNGKVGLCGISYYAITQWLVAALQPPHLTAMIPWEGCNDFYRDCCRHGGIASNNFIRAWYPRQVLSNQHGNPDGHMDPWLNERATGPSTLSAEELAKNRSDPLKEMMDRPLLDQFFTDRTPDLSRIQIPFLSAANWAGFGLHSRGNFEGFIRAASKRKWLEVHPGRHDEAFYLNDAMTLQRRFFDYFLKGIDNGWDRQPQLQIRSPSNPNGELRYENEWPLKRTQWTKMFLSAPDLSLASRVPTAQQQVQYEATGDGLLFSRVVQEETEITGCLAAKLFISSTTADADIFLTLQAFSPNGEEVTFQGALEPQAPLAQGWLRASHRKLDTTLSKPYRPYHTHNEIQPLTPGEVYELDVEVWTTHIILPANYKLVLRVAGKDFERPSLTDEELGWRAKGSGPFLHNLESDRGSEIYRGKTTIHTGQGQESYLLVPVIPKV